jgi:hypothetical protein
MATAKSKSGLTEAGFQHGRNMDILWQQLKDERRHDRKDVLSKLKLRPGKNLDERREGRLRRFIQHGIYPRDQSLYSWVTNHSHPKWLSIIKNRLSN